MPQPQLLLTLAPGSTMTLIVEQFHNGQRILTSLPEGGELLCLRQMLFEQKQRIEAEELRERQRCEAEIRARHQRVYTVTAQRFGDSFAERTIGPLSQKKKPTAPSINFLKML